MESQAFRNSPSGRLAQSLDECWAFVPNPLPPKLEPDYKLMQVLSDADRALGRLSGLADNLSNPYLLMRPFIRREAVASSRIEGTRADLADLYGFEAEQPPLPSLVSTSPQSDLREVLNYVRTMEYGLERMRDFPISLRFICELHERLLRGVRGQRLKPGEFRDRQNWITGPDGIAISEARYVPPPAAAMRECLDDFEKYLHAGDTYPPLMRLALIHYQFEAIHPFVDGNGRIGRLLISLLLVHWDLLPLPLLYLSSFFERHRLDYYDLLLEVSRRGAWREWIQFFLRGVAEESLDAVVRAKRLQDLQMEWRQRVQATPRASARLLQLVDNLFESPIVTVQQVRRSLNLKTHRSASQAVNRLVEEGVLHPEGGRTRNRRYAALEILQILGEDSK